MIAFDLFGVVFTEGHMVSGTLMPLLPAGTDKKLVKGFYQQYTDAQISESAFWQGIGLSNEQQNYSQLRDAFLNSFALDNDLPELIEKLSGCYAFSILSNLATDWADFLIDKFEFESTFDPIVVSGKEGVGKPHKRIYQALIKRSQLDANEIVFVDDSLENLATAHALGMQTVHYQREPDDFDYQADYQITSLKELLAIL